MKKQNENTTQNNVPPAGTPAAEGITSDGAVLSELRAENEQLKATIRNGEAHRQITDELEKAGARSPELLLASVKADLQFTEDGKLVNAAALFERLKTAHPEQFGRVFGSERPTGSIDAGAGGTVTPQMTKDALAKMKPAEIAALDWADVKRVLAAG